MAIEVVLTLSVEIGGDDYSTSEPDVQRITLENSPAQLFQYELQDGDNYLVVSDQIPPSCLWLDPQTPTGATFILKGATTDVGVSISSTNPSLIPVAQTTPLGQGQQVAPQYFVVLTSSEQAQTQVAWF